MGDLPRSGQPRKLTDAKVEAVVTRTLETRPPNATHWSTRTMAAASGPGQAERRTHDYYRHGTTSLFAALNVATGQIIGRCRDKHRQQEFLEFLRQIERTVPAHLEIHLVLNNYATHKTPKVAAWLKEATALPSALYAHEQFVALIRWSAGLPRSPANASAAASSKASTNSSPPSMTTSPSITATPNPLCGPPAPI